MGLDPNASSITVAVRVRPFTIREAAQLTKNDDGTVFLGDGALAAAPTPKLNQRGLRSVIKVVDGRCLVFDPPEDNPVQKFSRSVVPTAGKKVKDQVFAFDRIFDENATQTDVYEGTTKNLLDSVLDGYNATIFAYGATGCGKTHTITGTSQHPGIIFLTMQELFEKINERSEEKVTEISLSYLEIYNETIRDLLVPGGSKQGLMLREDSHQAVTVSGLTSHHPKDVQEVMDMIVQGNEYRTVSPTAANATSSRSHAVLQINIAQKDRNADVNEPHTMATLSIIDLAGSERASATKNRGERLIEGANINKSLLALGSCINALCDPRKKNHVPYRNSKLTRLLKFSLGGNCKTVMIVCVSPSSEHFDETQNTLRYANRAKNIQTKVTRNVFNVNRHVKDFLVKIDEQMALINELKAQQKNSEAHFFEKFRKQLERRQATAREGIQRLRTAYDNALPERQQKVADMKKLRAVETRIALLSCWIAAFDATGDQREDDECMPPNLVDMRKKALGVLVELEASRNHLHNSLAKNNWESKVDVALQRSLEQLREGEAADCGEVANLTREAELLKSNFARDATREVLEVEKSASASFTQPLLAAQFETITALSDTLGMNEEEAVAHAKQTIHSLLETGYQAVGNAVKPDGSLVPAQMFPPSKKGTPKRKRAVLNVQPVAAVPLAIATNTAPVHVFASPMKASPRRRKPIAAGARKGVSFTPVKRKSPSKRVVRWRDDETEEGTLADFEKTPQKFADSTPDHSSPEKIVAPKVPAYLQPEVETAEESSPSIEVPETRTILPAKANRFQAGFLSKGSRPSAVSGGSPSLDTPTLTFQLSSDSEERTTPLRSLSVSQANTLSPPGSGGSIPRRVVSPRLSQLPVKEPIDENSPPGASSVSATSSDSETSTLDAHKIRSALHSAKKQGARRMSSLTGTAPHAKRISSISSLSGDRPTPTHHRASSAYAGGALASSTNGISRQRRRSAERRRSPPMACSPMELVAEPVRTLTAGQARRMNLGGSVRLDASPSERVGTKDAKSRRITISGVSAAARRENARGSSVVWR